MLLNAQGKVITKPSLLGTYLNYKADEMVRQSEKEQELLADFVGVALYDASGDRVNTSKPQTVSCKPIRVPLQITNSKSNSKE